MSSLRERSKDEGGATLIIVAICLIVIMAMLVLTVDLGALFLRQRQMVNGADAAALAAALTCSNSKDTSQPETQADNYAKDNVPNLNVAAANNGITDVSSTCQKGGMGHVSVSYTIAQDLFFGPAIGLSNSRDVKATATAAWGPAGGGAAVPLVLDSGQLQSACDVPDVNNNGKICYLWYDNGSFAGTSNWGFMNLDQWNVAGDANCSSSGGSSTRGGYIQNNYKNILVLNGNPPGTSPTYVCVETGHATDNWQDFVTRFNTNPDILVPVNDCSGQVDKTGVAAPCPATPDKYDVIGFVDLTLQGVYSGTNGQSPTFWPTTSPCNNQNLPTPLNTNDQVDLAQIAATKCGASLPVSDITNVVVKDGNKTATSCTPSTVTASCDYIYDENTKAQTYTITWNRNTALVNGVISFTYDTNEPCGPVPSYADSNTVCLAVTWNEFNTGPGPVGGGKNFGPSSVELCDLTLNSCPKGS